MSDESLVLELKNKRICRFCMTQNEPLTNIYSMENRLKSSAPLPLQIMACVSIEVFSNDGMPCTICDDCRMWMEHCYRFKQMCKKSDNSLRQYPLTGTWPQPLQIPKLSKELIFKMYPDFYHTKKMMASTQTDKDKIMPAKTFNLQSSSKSKSKSSNPPVIINSNRELLAAINQHKLAARRQDDKPKRLLNKNPVKILNKIAQKNPEPILSQPIVKRNSSGNVEIITEILEQTNEEPIDPIKSAVPVETNVFPCPHCERSFPLRQLLDIHMVNHNRARSFQCDMCSKSFFSKYDLGKHMLIHTGEKPFECIVCKKAFTRSTLLHRHEKIHTDQPKYICVYCEKPFLSVEEMDKHTERHKKNRPFSCKICNKSFAFKQGLERHETVHAKEQPYPCQYCEFSFPTPSKLARHLTAHAGDRPFPCKLCPKSYLLSHHLTRHLRSHKQGSGSYKCFDCEKIFTTRDDLIYHSAVHATLTLICPLCKESFEDLDSVTEHIRNHAEGEQYACEFCDLIFMTSEKLQIHSDTEHLDDLVAYKEHDQSVKEANQNSTDSQKSANNNDDIIEEFIIEEYDEDEDDQQRQIIDEENIKKESEMFLSKDIIFSTCGNDDGNSKEQNFVECNDEIGMEIESLTRDEIDPFIMEESIDESPPQKIIKLSSKESSNTSYNLETSRVRKIASTSSSNQQGRKGPEEKKQQQQNKANTPRQSATMNAAIKHSSKSVASEKYKEMPSTSSSSPPSQQQQSLNTKPTRILNSSKISPSNKIEVKKSVISQQEKSIKKQRTEVNIKTEKNPKRNSSTNSNATKENPKISQNEKNNSTSSNTSENKEKRSSEISSSSSESPSTSENLNISNNKNVLEMVIGDRKVKVQKIMMTKAQVQLMAKEGKLELKDGAMILKNKSSTSNSDAVSDSNNDNSNRKIMTRSKQQKQSISKRK